MAPEFKNLAAIDRRIVQRQHAHVGSGNVRRMVPVLVIVDP